MATWAIIGNPSTKEVFGFWIADATMANNMAFLKMLAVSNNISDKQYVALESGKYRIVPNNADNKGGVFFMFFDYPAPGEALPTQSGSIFQKLGQFIGKIRSSFKSIIGSSHKEVDKSLIEKIQNGMSKADVINLLGKPDNITTGGDALNQLGGLMGSQSGMKALLNVELWTYKFKGGELEIDINSGIVTSTNIKSR